MLLWVIAGTWQQLVGAGDTQFQGPEHWGKLRRRQEDLSCPRAAVSIHELSLLALGYLVRMCFENGWLQLGYGKEVVGEIGEIERS